MPRATDMIPVRGFGCALKLIPNDARSAMAYRWNFAGGLPAFFLLALVIFAACVFAAFSPMPFFNILALIAS